MANYTLETLPAFPDGTTVGAYPALGQATSTPGPLGSPVDEEVVSGGSVTFSGLTEGESYVAFGLVNDVWRRITFSLDSPSHTPLFSDSDIDISGDWAFEGALTLPDNINLTGAPTAPTAPPGTDNTQIATTAFVQHPDSPEMTGIPTAPNPPSDEDSTQIATTAFVRDKMEALGIKVKDNGAVGDGTTSDTAAIQAVFDGLNAGDLVIFEAGDYAASGLSLATDDVKLLFMPGASLKNNAATTLLTVAGDNVEIEGGTINGNAQGQAGVNWNGVDGVMIGTTLIGNHRGLIFSDAAAVLDAYRVEAINNTNVGFYCGSGILRMHDCVARGNGLSGGAGAIFDTAQRGCRLSLTSSGNLIGVDINNAGGYCDYFRSRDDYLFGLRIGDASSALTPADWSFDYVEVRECGATGLGPEATGVELYGASGFSFGTVVGVKNPGYDVALTANGSAVGCSRNSFGAILADGTGAFDSDPAVHLSGGSQDNWFGLIYARTRTWAVSMNEGFGAVAEANTFESVYADGCDFGILRLDGALDNRFNRVTGVNCLTSGVGTWSDLIFFSGAGTAGNKIYNFEHRTLSGSAPSGGEFNSFADNTVSYAMEFEKVTQSYTDSGNVDFYQEGLWFVEVYFNDAVIGSALVSCAIWTDGSAKRNLSILASHSGWSAGAITFSVQSQDTTTGRFRVATAVGSGGTVTVSYRRTKGT